MVNAAQGPQNSSILDRRIPQPSDMSTCYVVKARNVQSFLFFPHLSELISRYIYLHPGSARFISARVHSCSLHLYIMVMNGSFCLYQDVYDLTISVSVAECVVFVLLFDFHLHCLAPALECKQDPLPGSVKGDGGVHTISLTTYDTCKNTSTLHLIKYYNIKLGCI